MPAAGRAGAPGSFYRRWRLVALDGTTLDVPDTAENVAHFGRPGSSRGAGGGAYPQVRVAALGECGTHAVFGAAMGPLGTHETVLARRVFSRLEPGMLTAADRGFVGVDLWREAAATGADLLWRMKNSAVLPPGGSMPTAPNSAGSTRPATRGRTPTPRWSGSSSTRWTGTTGPSAGS